MFRKHHHHRKGYYNRKFIGEIREFALTEIPEMLDEINDEAEYQEQCRIPLNVLIIEFCFGAEFRKPKHDGGKCSLDYKHRRPTPEQIAELTKIVDEFVKEVEDPFLDSLVPADKEDIKVIPERDDFAVPTLERVNSNKIRNYVFGYNGKASMTRAKIVASDIPAIANLGYQVRKNIKQKRMLLIGGIVLIVAGGVTTALVIHNMKKKSADVDDIMAEDLAELDDIAEEAAELDETPMVTLED